MSKKSGSPILKAIEELYEKERKKIVPPYPFDQKSGKIELPEVVIAELKSFLDVGNKPAAVKRVIELTGTGLRMSKDYVDALQKPVFQLAKPMTNTYAEPISKLLTVGRPEGEGWLDYSTLGITQEHIPELIQLVEDHDLRILELPEGLPDEAELPEWFAQIHAWRALGQLKAEEAIPAIIGSLHQVDDEDDDWIGEDAQEVFALIGPVAIRPLTKYLADDTNGVNARVAAATSLRSIGETHPETRDECLSGIVSLLEKYEENDEGLNGFLIYELVKLKAVEHIGVIEKAFVSDHVDVFIMDDFEDVQVELGLIDKRTAPRPRMSLLDRLPHEENLFVPERKAPNIEKKEKNKRMQEKKSRKKNRKRK
jgi:ribosomal protein L7/L12